MEAGRTLERRQFSSPGTVSLGKVGGALAICFSCHSHYHLLYFYCPGLCSLVDLAGGVGWKWALRFVMVRCVGMGGALAFFCFWGLFTFSLCGIFFGILLTPFCSFLFLLKIAGLFIFGV